MSLCFIHLAHQLLDIPGRDVVLLQRRLQPSGEGVELVLGDAHPTLYERRPCSGRRLDDMPSEMGAINATNFCFRVGLLLFVEQVLPPRVKSTFLSITAQVKVVHDLVDVGLAAEPFPERVGNRGRWDDRRGRRRGQRRPSRNWRWRARGRAHRRVIGGDAAAGQRQGTRDRIRRRLRRRRSVGVPTDRSVWRRPAA